MVRLIGYQSEVMSNHYGIIEILSYKLSIHWLLVCHTPRLPYKREVMLTFTSDPKLTSLHDITLRFA